MYTYKSRGKEVTCAVPRFGFSVTSINESVRKPPSSGISSDPNRRMLICPAGWRINSTGGGIGISESTLGDGYFPQEGVGFVVGVTAIAVEGTGWNGVGVPVAFEGITKPPIKVGDGVFVVTGKFVGGERGISASPRQAKAKTKINTSEREKRRKRRRIKIYGVGVSEGVGLGVLVEVDKFVGV